MGIRIVLAEGETIGLALRRFKKLLDRNGVSWELRRYESFAKKSERRRAKEFKKRFRARAETLQARIAGQQASTLSVTELTKKFWKNSGKP